MRRKKCWGVGILVAVILVGVLGLRLGSFGKASPKVSSKSYVLKSVSGERKGTSVKKCQRLKVKGTKIVNESGKTVQLKGASTHGIAWFPAYVNQKQFSSWKKFGANTIRLAYYSDPSAGFQTSQSQIVEKGVEYATKSGMYVIIDWHILSDGNPKTNEKAAKKFFTSMSKKYKNYTNVIYEICNEPNGDVTWTKDIKPYAKRMIKVIRAHDKKAIIIVGTPTWSQDVDVVAKSPIKDQKNIVYALHFYAATHTDYLRDKAVAALKKKLPLFVSEYNICDASGTGSLNKEQGKKWMSLIKKYKLGYIAWNISNKEESSALIKSTCRKVGTIKKSDLSPSGAWIVKQW